MVFKWVRALFLCAAVTGFSGYAAAQHSPLHSTNVPISSLDINGVNLNMNAGEIIRALEARGYKASRHALGYRIAGKTINDPVTGIPRSSESMQIRVPNKPRNAGPFTDDDKPSAIEYTYNRKHMSGEEGSAPPTCDVVEGVVRKICPGGKGQLPCVSRGEWLTNLKIFNQQNANYTMTYGLQAKIDGSPTRVNCNVSVNQGGTGLPAAAGGARGGGR